MRGGLPAWGGGAGEAVVDGGAEAGEQPVEDADQIMLISDGDVSGVIATALPESGVDMYMAPDSWRALYANTLAQVFIENDLNARYEMTRHATNWLQERVTDLKDKVLQSKALVDVNV